MSAEPNLIGLEIYVSDIECMHVGYVGKVLEIKFIIVFVVPILVMILYIKFQFLCITDKQRTSF